MKTHLTLVISIAALVFNPLLRAATPAEQEFTAARAARAKALADAAAPINRRYMETLNLLFRKATQAAELDLASAIRTEMQSVGGTAAVAEAGKSVTPPKALESAGSVPTRSDLKNLIENTTWVREGKDGVAINFFRNGTMKGSGAGFGGGGWSYSLEAPDVVKLEKKGDKPADKTHMHFRVDVSQMTMTKDPTKSSGPGGLVLKYVGPAPKK